MKYHLLTGATGLLGRYLVRDLLAAGVPLAVLVRPGKAQTPDDRLEAIMAHWDAAGRCLPGPWSWAEISATPVWGLRRATPAGSPTIARQ